MTTKATRDVINLGNPNTTDRPIIEAVDINGDKINFEIDGTHIGLNDPADGQFENLSIDAGGTLTFEAGSSMIITDVPLTVVGTLHANYADLAEYYESDEQYPAGTVVSINVHGDSEITASKGDLDKDVIGVISTNPAYVLNAGKDGLYLPVAQIGRVPCLIHGPVKKGDRVIPCCVGHAQSVANTFHPAHKMIVGRAMETNDDPGVKLIEIVINTLK